MLLAFRYLRPKRTFVSVITLICVLGVTVGVAVPIIVISVMSGFDHDLREKILGFNPHLRVVEPGRTMKDYEAVARLVSSNRNVRIVAPLVIGQVMVETEPASGQRAFAAPLLRGIDPKLEPRISALSTNIVSGKFDVSNRGLLVGIDMASDLGLDVGNRLLIHSPSELEKLEQIRENKNKEGQELIIPDEYEIRGIFDVGYYEYDSRVLITSLEDAQELYVLNDSVHGLIVMLRDAYSADLVKVELEKMLGPAFRVTSWMEENKSILGAVSVEKTVMFVILFFIMIVAALCIASAVITFVVQKTREIGMLKALGASDLQVSGLFLSQSAFVGTVGVTAGLGLSILLLTYRNPFLEFLRRTTHIEIFPASIYGFDKLPCLIEPFDIAIICGGALIICVMGGLIPAWRAGRLKPVEALRYE